MKCFDLKIADHIKKNFKYPKKAERDNIQGKVYVTFIIDKEGVIQYYTVNNLLCGRSINEILRVLKSIQYVKQNPGYACPVDWKHGDRILYSHPLKSRTYFKESYSSEKF